MGVPSEGAMEEYNDSHRRFVQAFMCRRILSDSEVDALCKDSCSRVQPEASASQRDAFLKTVNAQLCTFDLLITAGWSEQDGARFYVLVNRGVGAETPFCTGYTELELRFLQVIIEEVVTRESGDISSMTAINLVSQLQRPLSRSRAEAFLQKFVADHWLEEPAAGRVALHTRCLVELAPYLMSQFPDHVRACRFCRRVSVRGVRCSRCDEKYHVHCVKRIPQQEGKAACVGCGSVLPDPRPSHAASQR